MSVENHVIFVTDTPLCPELTRYMGCIANGSTDTRLDPTYSKSVKSVSAFFSGS